LRAITGNDAEVIAALERILDTGEFQQGFRAANELLALKQDPARLVPMLSRALEQSPDEPGMFIQEIGRPLATGTSCGISLARWRRSRAWRPKP
jgi:hypothetical protein